jgi:predicted nuclease of predicted toxin-antitoxin system
VRWLADECVDAPLVTQLRAAGHDVTYMAEVASATADTEIIARAHVEQRILLTEDKDFGELVFRRRLPVPGLVLLRIAPERNTLKWPRLSAAMGTLGDDLIGRYTVVDEARVRSRSLVQPI